MLVSAGNGIVLAWVTEREIAVVCKGAWMALFTTAKRRRRDAPVPASAPALTLREDPSSGPSHDAHAYVNLGTFMNPVSQKCLSSLALRNMTWEKGSVMLTFVLFGKPSEAVSACVHT